MRETIEALYAAAARISARLTSARFAASLLVMRPYRLQKTQFAAASNWTPDITADSSALDGSKKRTARDRCAGHADRGHKCRGEEAPGARALLWQRPRDCSRKNAVAQRAVHPPSTTSVAPVMYADAGDARNTIAPS